MTITHNCVQLLAKEPRKSFCIMRQIRQFVTYISLYSMGSTLSYKILSVETLE